MVGPRMYTVPTRAAVLDMVEKAGEKGVTVSQVARRLHPQRSNAAAMDWARTRLSELAGDGLVLMRIDPADRRRRRYRWPTTPMVG